MAIALAVVVSFVSGYLLVCAGWLRAQPNLFAWLMKLSLAAGFGLGISSAAYFLARMIGGDHFIVVDLLILVVLCILYAYVLARRQSGPTASPQPVEDIAVSPRLTALLTGSFLVAIVVALYDAVVGVLAHPHGDGWDAFAIWNLHARFLFRGGSHWRDGFNPLIPWSHPDYPLLLPAATARFWSYLGHDSPPVPAIIGLAFTFSALTLLVSSLWRLRGPNAALLAGITLSATPFFLEQGTAQYADVPLSFFILATIVLLHFRFQQQSDSSLWQARGPLALAGISASFAAWTKNEGLLFVIATCTAHVCFFARKSDTHGAFPNSSGRPRDLLVALFGSLPMLALIAWFKHSVATAGDLFSSPPVMLEKILTPSRYWATVRWYFREFFRFGDWWIIPGTVVLILFYLLAHGGNKTLKHPGLRPSLAALALTLAGYFVIYLITPRDIYWHLRFSLNRLFLQLWPASLFLFFLFVGCKSPLAGQNQPKTTQKV